MRTLPQSKLTKRQAFNSEWRSIPKSEYGEPAKMRVNIRYDDNCGNGHNSFAITADIKNAKKYFHICRLYRFFTI